MTQRKYPWEEWFAGGFTVLLRGVDYHCSQSSMVQLIRNRASATGLKLRITDTGTEIILVVVGRRSDEVPNTGPSTPVAAEPNINQLAEVKRD